MFFDFWGIFFWTDLLSWRFFGYFFVICGHFWGVFCGWYVDITAKKNRVVYRFTLPETNELQLKMLKMDGWNTKFLLGWPIFGGELLFLRSVLILLAGVHPNFFSCVFRSLVGEGVIIFKELLFLLLLGEMMQVDNLRYFKRLQTINCNYYRVLPHYCPTFLSWLRDTTTIGYHNY